MCSGRQYGSTDRQHNFFFGQIMTLALVQFFTHDFLRSNYTSFDAYRKGEHDSAKVNGVPLLSQKLLLKNVFRKNAYF